MSINRVKEGFYYTDGNITGKAHKSWYRGKTCNFNPNIKNILEVDSVDKYILAGWLPDAPFIDKTTVITTFGSCFALYISEYLDKKGYNASLKDGNNLIDFKAGVNNTFAIRQLIEWVYNGKSFAEETWHRDDKSIIEKSESLRSKTLERFLKTDVFIITLGLSEIWYNKETNDVFWRAIPEDQFDHNKHGFRVSTFQENKDNIRYIYNTIISFNKNAKVIFTISPVPLVATFRPVSCLSANSVSKAILRAAIDEFYREENGDNIDNIFYWPSYEIVEKIFNYKFNGGAYDFDYRHIKKECVTEIMRLFGQYYTI